MGLGGVAIATLPSVICAKLMFSDGLGGAGFYCYFCHARLRNVATHDIQKQLVSKRRRPCVDIKNIKRNLHASPSALQALALGMPGALSCEKDTADETECE